MYAHPVGYVLARGTSDLSFALLKFVAAVRAQVSTFRLVFVYVIVNGRMRYLVALLGEYRTDLFRQIVLSYQCYRLILQLFADATVAGETLLPLVGKFLGVLPGVAAFPFVACEFPAYRLWVDSNCFRNFILRNFILQKTLNCVPLLRDYLFVHGNANLVNLFLYEVASAASFFALRKKNLPILLSVHQGVPPDGQRVKLHF